MEDEEKKENHLLDSFLRDTFPLAFLELSSEEELPKDPLKRCHARWFTLFLEVLRALHKRNAANGILVALENSGLTSNDLSDPNPSDETLQRIVKLKNKLAIPNMRGKKRMPMEHRAINAFINFSMILSEFKDFKKVVGNPKNPNARVHKGVLYLEKRIPKIVSFMDLKGDLKQKDIPDKLMKNLASHPKIELVKRLTAYLSGTKYETFKKHLNKARKNNPKLAQLWKNGWDMMHSPD